MWGDAEASAVGYAGDGKKQTASPWSLAYGIRMQMFCKDLPDRGFAARYRWPLPEILDNRRRPATHPPGSTPRARAAMPAAITPFSDRLAAPSAGVGASNSQPVRSRRASVGSISSR